MGYDMPKWSTPINHLAYADDTIIFASANRYSLEKINSVLQAYEEESCQKINREKSAFYMYQNATATEKQLVEECIGMSSSQFPLKYLGCPITHARKRKVHYVELIQKVKSKLQGWKGQMLSYGGKEVLISSVLQSVPIYVVSAVVPPNCVMKELHKIFTKFFWSNKVEGKSKHWAS